MRGGFFIDQSKGHAFFKKDTVMVEFDAVQNDSFCKKMISKSDSEDVFDWLNQSKDVLLGESFFRDDIEAMLAELLQSNILKIWVVDVYDEGDIQTAKSLCIELPDDKVARENVLDFSNVFIEDQGFDRLEDCDQRYVYVPFD